MDLLVCASLVLGCNTLIGLPIIPLTIKSPAQNHSMICYRVVSADGKSIFFLDFYKWVNADACEGIQ